jgi:hypothetical protein
MARCTHPFARSGLARYVGGVRVGGVGYPVTVN